MSIVADIRAYTASDLGQALKRERKALGLTQEGVAKKAGITRQTVIDLEQGKNTSVYVLMGVMAALGKALSVVDARPSFAEMQSIFAADEDDDDGQQDQDAARHHAPRRGG